MHPKTRRRGFIRQISLNQLFKHRILPLSSSHLFQTLYLYPHTPPGSWKVTNWPFKAEVLLFWVLWARNSPLRDWEGTESLVGESLHIQAGGEQETQRIVWIYQSSSRQGVRTSWWAGLWAQVENWLLFNSSSRDSLPCKEIRGWEITKSIQGIQFTTELKSTEILNWKFISIKIFFNWIFNFNFVTKTFMPFYHYSESHPWATSQTSAAKELQMLILPESYPWRGDSQAWGLCVQCWVSGNAAKPKLSGKGHNKSATITNLLLQPGHLFQLYKGHFQPQIF